MTHHHLDTHSESYHEEFKFHDENIFTLAWYSRRIMKTLMARRSRSILSLGIGHKVVSSSLVSAAESFESYTIIEGSQEMIREFKIQTILPDNVAIVHSLFEEFKSDKQFDIIEAGFVLEHVEDPLLLLQIYSKLLKPGGCMFIAVPNAKSLHRRLGHEAGLLDNIYKLSPHDLALGHKRYFDLESLRKIVSEAGLQIITIEGIYLKPFSLNQLRSLALSEDIMEALFKVASEYPELSNAIYLEATI